MKGVKKLNLIVSVKYFGSPDNQNFQKRLFLWTVIFVNLILFQAVGFDTDTYIWFTFVSYFTKVFHKKMPVTIHFISQKRRRLVLYWASQIAREMRNSSHVLCR